MWKIIVATDAAGGTTFFAATKNGVGRGRSSSQQTLQAGHFLSRQRRIESDAEDRRRNRRCRRAILHRHDDCATSIRKSGPEIKNRCTKEGVNGEKLTSIPKSGPEIKNRCTQERVNGENLASILKSGLEIKNRCTQEGVNEEILALIPKFDPEIKNRCTKEGENGEKLTSIRKFGLEIKNRCTRNQGFIHENRHPLHPAGK